MPGFLFSVHSLCFNRCMNQVSKTPNLVALFTDFGIEGFYTGQMEMVLAGAAVPVINLLSDAPVFNARASAYLLSALATYQPADALFLAVVDPGVGGSRLPLLVRTDKHWFVGPDNGLFSQVVNRSSTADIQRILWRPDNLSNSFHGRDLFAPVADRLCRQLAIESQPVKASDLVGIEWPEDLAEIIYIDRYANLISGVRANTLSKQSVIQINGLKICYARTFSQVGIDQLFWYENSIGLVEIAANQGQASRLVDATVGMELTVHSP